MLGFTFGELVVCAGLLTAVLGTKDVPKLARGAGVLAGRAAGFLFTARSAAHKYAQEANLVELHKEVTQGVQQLDSIRHEIRGGMRFFSNPVSFAASSLAQGQPQHQPQAASSRAGAPPARSGRDYRESAGGTGGRDPASAAADMHAAAPSGFAVGAIDPQPQPAAKSNHGGRSDVRSSMSMTALDDDKNDLKARLRMLPVSAVAAGRVPDRSGTIPTGADVMMDALMERKVALQAKTFIEGAPSSPPGPGAAEVPSRSSET